MGFEEHLEETRQHVKNVEQAFEKLGEKPTAEKCPGIDGIKKEHDDFMADEKPSDQVCDMFLTGAAAACGEEQCGRGGDDDARANSHRGSSVVGVWEVGGQVAVGKWNDEPDEPAARGQREVTTLARV